MLLFKRKKIHRAAYAWWIFFWQAADLVPVLDFLKVCLLSYVDELTIIKMVVKTVFFHQIFVSTLFDDLPVFHDEDPVCIADGRKTMGNDEAGTALHELVKGFLDLQLGTGIDAGGGFIQDQHGRQAEHNTRDTEKLFLSLA